MPPVSPYQRWRSHRRIEREFGRDARQLAATLTDLAFPYYLAYLEAGTNPAEAHRLARKSGTLGDDATSYDYEG